MPYVRYVLHTMNSSWEGGEGAFFPHERKGSISRPLARSRKISGSVGLPKFKKLGEGEREACVRKAIQGALERATQKNSSISERGNGLKVLFRMYRVSFAIYQEHSAVERRGGKTLRFPPASPRPIWPKKATEPGSPPLLSVFG